VQYVVRPRTESHPDYRGYAGLVAAGTVRVGDEVTVLPDGQRTRVEGIDVYEGTRETAHAGQSVVLRLADDLGVARGTLLAAPGAPEPVAEFDATLAWLHDKPLRPGARLLLKHGTRTVQAIVGAVTHRLDTDSLSVVEDPGELGINDMGQVSLTVSEPLPLDPYDEIAATGSFLLVDPQAGDTLAAGLVGRPLVARPLQDLETDAS
jgi:sulfate adenylyltransferase subunit 1